MKTFILLSLIALFNISNAMDLQKKLKDGSTDIEVIQGLAKLNFQEFTEQLNDYSFDSRDHAMLVWEVMELNKTMSCLNKINFLVNQCNVTLDFMASHHKGGSLLGIYTCRALMNDTFFTPLSTLLSCGANPHFCVPGDNFSPIKMAQVSTLDQNRFPHSKKVNAILNAYSTKKEDINEYESPIDLAFLNDAD